MASLGLLILALPELTSGAIGLPFMLNAFHFNYSIGVPLNSEVYLHCGYYTPASTNDAFTLSISFVPVDRLTQKQLAVVDSGSFFFPKELERAHEDMGEVLNKTYFEPPANKSGSVTTSVKFNMAHNSTGSYICQIYLTSPSQISDEDWTLTRWMYLEVRSSPTYREAFVPFALVGVLIVACFFALRPRRVIFRRVLIEKSPLYATPDKPTVYKPPKITIVDGRPPFMLYIREVIQHTRSKRLSNLAIDDKEDAYSPTDSSSEAGDSANNRLYFCTPSDKSFEVPLNRLRVERPLGQGAFGIVYLGSAVNLPGGMKG
ncbi:unnamed protein product, partial [Rodentolepis nana]|uniref:Protein kinase domain-containing protein n=1 Tax=Rodentolepis nana TaxID=102285 RepID=A0A0R3TFU4_RODNA